MFAIYDRFADDARCGLCHHPASDCDHSVSDQEIIELRTEAEATQDYELVEYCTWALAGDSGCRFEVENIIFRKSNA